MMMQDQIDRRKAITKKVMEMEDAAKEQLRLLTAELCESNSSDADMGEVAKTDV
jgi:hypothetical protein